MNYQAIALWFASLNPGWTNQADQALVDYANFKITDDQATLSASEIYDAVFSDDIEWDQLSADNQAEFWHILSAHSGGGVPTKAGTPARQRIVKIFQTVGADTITRLSAKIQIEVTRIQVAEIDGEPINAGIIELSIADVQEIKRRYGGG